MANVITSCRIICSITMLFFPAFSPRFDILYVICGFTDMTDGAVARKTNTVSEFGSKLDTAADFIFLTVCLIKLLPTMEIPTWLWIWFSVIAVIKTINVVSGFILQKKLVAAHTLMNKVTGILLFLLPLNCISLNCSIRLFLFASRQPLPPFRRGISYEQKKRSEEKAGNLSAIRSTEIIPERIRRRLNRVSGFFAAAEKAQQHLLSPLFTASSASQRRRRFFRLHCLTAGF